MALNIIIDKSAFQSFSYPEIIRLTNYYTHNIAPVLVMEILGDLKKEDREGNVPQNRVIDFAKKLFPMSSIVNVHYAQLITGEFTRNPLPLDGRPTIPLQKIVQNQAGHKGMVAAETQEEKAIFKWREGQFTEADHQLSELWRDRTTQPDLLINLRDKLKEGGGKLKVGSFEGLNKLATAILDDLNSQQEFLIDIMRYSGITPSQAVQLLSKWQQSGRPLLKEFIPYTYHCRRVNTLFYMGLQSDLISTRPTNKVDLEYLYYLPFCHIFTSNDKVHKDLAPLLIKSWQKFLPGTQLKNDLQQINKFIDGLPEAERKAHKDQPPINPDSLTFNFWREYFGYPERTTPKTPLSSGENKRAISKMEEFLQTSEGDEVTLKDGEETQFVTRITYLSKTDPCYCGSGKKIVDCCIPDEKFNSLIADQIAKSRNKENLVDKNTDRLKVLEAHGLQYPNDSEH